MRASRRLIFSIIVALGSLQLLSAQEFIKDSTTMSKDSVLLCANTEIKLQAKQGDYSYKWSSGQEESMISILAEKDSTFYVTMTDVDQKQTVDSIHLSVRKIVPEQIGLVTFNEDGDQIIVAWERKYGEFISSYELFRNQENTDRWELLDTIDYNSFTVSVDSSAEVLSNYYNYRLVSKDSVCGTSAESNVHRPMYIKASLNESGALFECKAYKGVEETDYDIVEYMDEQIRTIASVPTYKGYYSYEYVYEDYSDGNCFRMTMELDDTVKISSLKTDSGPYSQSISNIAEINLTTGVENSDPIISIYPQPASSYFTINSNNSEFFKVELYSVDGKQVFSNTCKSGEQLDISNISEGIYFAKIASGTDTVYELFLIE